jgi:iron complex transport system ATP-binding protein
LFVIRYYFANGNVEFLVVLLEARNVAIGYSHRKIRWVVADGIDVQLRTGELVCLLGPNGAGKSTFLRTIAAMQPALGGQVLLDGRDIHKLGARALARTLSVVLTERISAGLMTAYALVSLGRYPYTDFIGRLNDHDHEIIQRAMASVGAADLAFRNVAELSDGERQKVMMARALAQEPRLMILDEITAFLDLPRRVEIMRILRRLAREQRCTILLSTHDLDLALRTADRIWLLPKSDGGKSTTLQIGAPEDLVLDGSFEAAFASEGLDFDREAGNFSVHEHTVGEIALDGTGIAAIWTRRALIRLGYSVVSAGPSGPRVEVRTTGTQTAWFLSTNHGVEQYDSIESLTNALRKGMIH